MRCLAVLLTLLLLDFGVAAADRATREAKRRFEKANVHYNLGEFREALEEYKEAYRLKPLSGFLFNIAQCLRNLGELKEAVVFYEKYLEAAPATPNRGVVESLIRESRTKLEEERRAKEEAAAASAAEEAEQRRRAELEAQASQPTTAPNESVPPGPAPVPVPLPGPTRPSSRTERHPFRIPSLIGAGAGLVLVGTGVWFGLGVADAQTSFDDARCGDPEVPLSASQIATCRDDLRRGEKNASLANVLWGAGALAVAGSVALLLIDPGGPGVVGSHEPSAQTPVVWGVSPGGAWVKLAW